MRIQNIEIYLFIQTVTLEQLYPGGDKTIARRSFLTEAGEN
jgi:hypothetical protein